MARAVRALVAARRHLVDSRRELWNDPQRRSDIYREASSLIPSADLAQWATSLPFPMASALWAYESKGDSNPHARRDQMFHFREATIQFHVWPEARAAAPGTLFTEHVFDLEDRGDRVPVRHVAR